MLGLFHRSDSKSYEGFGFLGRERYIQYRVQYPTGHGHIVNDVDVITISLQAGMGYDEEPTDEEFNLAEEAFISFLKK